MRIAATGGAAEMFGRRVLSGAWHTFTGWVTFVAAVAVLVQIGRLLSRGRPAGVRDLATAATS
jgi:hypothetical protein